MTISWTLNIYYNCLDLQIHLVIHIPRCCNLERRFDTIRVAVALPCYAFSRFRSLLFVCRLIATLEGVFPSAFLALTFAPYLRSRRLRLSQPISLQQNHCNILESSFNSHEERSVAVVTPRVQRRTPGEQERCSLRLPPVRCRVQGREALRICSFNKSSAIQKHFHDASSAVLTSKVEGSPSPFIKCIDFRITIYKAFCFRVVARHGRKMQLCKPVTIPGARRSQQLSRRVASIVHG
eukprot:scaffold2835_cov259-Pinguiococcus_pyrenoidosus.AAC.8